jgi:hypothetical protein
VLVKKFKQENNGDDGDSLRLEDSDSDRPLESVGSDDEETKPNPDEIAIEEKR